MTTDASPDVRRILSRLGGLRTRIRGIFATIGVSRWVVAAVSLLALFFLADWLLDLPLGVRRFVRFGLLQPPSDMPFYVLIPLLAASLVLVMALTRRNHGAAPIFAFIVAGIAGVLAWFAVRLFFPMRVRLPDQELALSVESKFRHLKDRLAAALDFEKELRNPTRGESVTMMRAVIDEAADEARNIRFSKAVSGARAARWAGGATLAVALAAVLTASFSDTVGLWAQRSLLLRDVSWPRATTMVAVNVLADGRYEDHDPAKPYFVAIGRTFKVYARAEGEVPDEALVFDLVEGQDPLARRMLTVTGSEGLFEYEFRDVRRPFRFFVRGGDDTDSRPVYDVQITIPPRVLDIQSTITFPEYLQRKPETVADGSVTVPEGSRVAVSFAADVEVETAEAVFGEEALEVTRQGSGTDARFGFSYEAKQSGPIRIVMRTPDGKLNDPSADTYEVRVKLDQTPRIDWIYPRISVEVTPTGRVPLLARATDDHGVTRLALDLRVGGEEPTRFELRPYEEDPAEEAGPPLAANDGAYGRRQILSYLPVEIARLRDTEGAALVAPAAAAFRIVAFDSRGQSRESEWARIDVSEPAGLERGLASQRSNVRLSLEAVLRDQKGRRDEVQSLLTGPLGNAELDLLKTVRFGQSKIAQDADRTVQELFGIFNAFVFDRLGSANPNAKILGYIDRHHRATYGLPEKAPDGAAPRRGVREWKGDPVFPYSLYRAIVTGWQNKEIYDRGLLDKMCAVLDHAERIGARLAPAAHAAATDAVSGDRAAVQALLKAQDENVLALQAMHEAMRGWQSLSDVTLWLRGIIDAQEALLLQIEKDDDK